MRFQPEPKLPFVIDLTLISLPGSASTDKHSVGKGKPHHSLPLDRDSSHRLTVESPEAKHLAGVVQR